MEAIQKQQFAFQSSGMRSQDAFEQWHREISVTHEVTLPPGDAFQMDCAFTRVGPLVISRGAYSGQTFVRDRGHIRRDHLDQCGVFVQPVGERVIVREGRGVRMQAYDLRLFDLAQVDHSVTAPGISASIYLPRNVMESAIPDFSRFHGVIRRDPAARLLAQHLAVINRYLPHIPEDQLPDFVDTTLEMVFGTLEVPGETDPEQRAQSAMLRRMERYIEERLHDPDLDPAAIAKAFGLSRSAIYRLFAGHGGIARFIKQRRLARAHRLIAAAAPDRAISSMVDSFGYRSPVQFWRNFRDEFGYAPGEVRAEVSDDVADSALGAIFQPPHS